MDVALKLKKDVTLCPYMSDAQIEWGSLLADACIANIGTSVDCEKAECGQESDKKRIDAAILQSQNGFKGIDASVEVIRLNYLLK